MTTLHETTEKPGINMSEYQVAPGEYQFRKPVSAAEALIPEEPEFDGWVCYLFGNGAIQWRPYKHQTPNAFVRWMMKVCFNCHWERK